MDSLIPVINKLQDVFHSVGMLDTIDLPQIAVVGAQSSGKSSVLENIVGKDFLPRGSGIVTRRPLVLQLNTVPQDKGEWAEFLHAPKQKFTDFADVREEIAKETDRLTGKNKGVSALPIHLKVYSPNVLNLTLIDLPGLTKVAIGDQPKDIEDQIRKMILQFISKPNCIILAVSPANADLANSDALKIAAEVDKRGVRTLGVLTKLDLMDEGTDAMDILNGKVYTLRRGFIGVVNRGQKDIVSNKQISKSLEDEKRFFQNHPIYGSIANRMGTAFLSKTLNAILLNHIRVCLPDIKNKVQALMVQAQQRLDTYGAPLEEQNMSQGAMILQLVTKFTQTYIDCIDGRVVSQNPNELFGGARINSIFTTKYTPSLLKMDACENLSDEDIGNCIRNAKGPRTSLFVPEAAFEMLVKKQVKILQDPSLRCIDKVFDELTQIVDYSDKDLIRFPNLREKVKDFVVNLLRDYTVPCKTYIRDMIETEQAYINTNHPDFFGGGAQAVQLIEKMSTGKQQIPQTQQDYTVKGKTPPKPLPQPTQNDSDWQNVDPYSTQMKKSSGKKPVKKMVKKFRKVNKPKQSKPQTQAATNKKRDSGAKKNNFFSNFFGGAPQQNQNLPPPEDDVFEDEDDEEEIEEYFEEEIVYEDDDEQEEQFQPIQVNSVTQQNVPQMSESELYQKTQEDREQNETNIIKALLQSYFAIVRKTVSDSTPKAAMHFLVNRSKKELQNELVKNLYKEELFNELLKENDDIAAKRKATQKMLEVLQKANSIINEVRDLKIQ